MQAAGLKISEPEVWGVGPRMCFSDNFLQDADAAGPRTVLREASS